MSRFSVRVIGVLALVVGVLGVAHPASAATLFVGETADYTITTDQGAAGLDAGDTVTWNPGAGSAHGAPVPGLIFGTNAFLTIQDAVNAATAGDTIRVAAGTYAELVTVNNPLTILGNQFGVDARDPARTGLPATESVVTGSAGSTSFNIIANDVIIDGFTVQDATSGIALGAGIVLGAGTAGSEIRNNIVQNNIAGLFLANNSPANQTIIERNLFQNNNQPGPNSGTAIYSDQFVAGGVLTNVLIDNNSFINNSSSGVSLASSQFNSQSNITVSNNTFTTNGNAVVFFNTNSSSITGNTISGSLGSQIGIFDNSNTIAVTGNTITNGQARAIRAENLGGGPVSSLTLSNNTITQNVNLLTSGLSLVDLVDVGGISTVSNNTITLSGANDAIVPFTHGIDISGIGTGTFTVSDNTLNGANVDTAAGTNDSIGIRARNLAAASNIVITNDNVQGFVFGIVGANAAGATLTLADVTLLNNQGFGGTPGGGSLDGFSLVNYTPTTGNTADVVAISNTQIQHTRGGSVQQAIFYSNIASLVVNGDGGNDTIDATTLTNASPILTLNGGPGNDLLTGGSGADTLNGGDDDDTLDGNPGNDVQNGGNGNDIILWNNGDNSDSNDGDAGTDLMRITGATAAGDAFTLGQGEARLFFARTNLIPFTLNIGTVERVEVNGSGGNDTFNVQSTLSGVPVDFNGGAGDDAVSVDSNGAAAAGTVDNLFSILSIDGGAGTNSLAFDDEGDTSGDDIVISPTQVGGSGSSAFGAGGRVDYANIAMLSYLGTEGADTFNVSPSATTAITLDGNAPTRAPTGDQLIIDFSGSTGATLNRTGPASGQYTFTNRQPITFSDIEEFDPGIFTVQSTLNVAENAGALVVTITRTGSFGAASVQVATAGGTAVSGVDFTPLTTTLNFAAGETSKTISVPILNDSIVESTEIFTLALTNASPGASVGTPATSTISILDDESQLLISISSASAIEGDVGTNANFVVQLSNPSSSTVTVAFATQDGNAVAPADYQSTSGTLTFAPGETIKTIVVPIVGDTRDEGNETFFMRLSNATVATLVSDTAIGFIEDNDVAKLNFAIDDVLVKEGDSNIDELRAEAVFTVTLSATSDRIISVRFSTGGGTASEGRDYERTSGVLIFTPGETSRSITVPILGDTFIEGDETFIVTLSNPTAGSIAAGSGTGTIVDDDANQPAPVIAFIAPKIGELTTSLNAVFGTVYSVSPATVTVRIQREADRKYFSGRNWGIAPLGLSANVADNMFSLPSSFIPRDTNLHDGKYNLTAIARDAEGRETAAAVTVHVDQNGPRVTFNAPLDGARLPSLPTIYGRAVDPIGGTGTQQVVLSIQRSSDGKFWSGRNWSVREVALSTQLSGNTFVRSSSLPTGANLKPDVYFISAVALDRLRNRGVAQVRIEVIPSAGATTVG